MPRLAWHISIFCFILLAVVASAQEETAGIDESAPADINGTWITQSGNMVEVEVEGTSVRLYFPAYAKTMTATLNGSVLVYITHYNDPSREECYLDVPDSERSACEGFIHRGDPRHRFTLTLSPDGMVLAGVKEINVLRCEWDTDEDGNTYNHRPIGYEWRYFSDYQWRRANCDFTGMPPLGGNVLEKYSLIEALFDRFGLAAEFSLGEFEPSERIRFEYAQGYIDADTGEPVSASDAAEHQHLEPLDGRVRLDEATGLYVIDLYPYAFESYVTLLSGLTILCHQLKALESTEGGLAEPTTQMEIDSVNYVWQHRQALCSLDDELFDHHIDFLSRALQYRAMAEN